MALKSLWSMLFLPVTVGYFQEIWATLGSSGLSFLATGLSRYIIVTNPQSSHY